jgi:hypothetical protein
MSSLGSCGEEWAPLEDPQPTMGHPVPASASMGLQAGSSAPARRAAGETEVVVPRRRTTWIVLSLVLVSVGLFSIERSTVAEPDPGPEPGPIVDQWTPTTKVFRNSDGTLTAEISGGPVQAPDPESQTGWSAIDTTLASSRDGVTPRHTDSKIQFSSGGNGSLASVLHDGTSLEIGWGNNLPTPDLIDDTASYGGVLPGVDATVQALPNGFEVSFVVDSASNAPRALELPLNLQGLRASLTKEGELILTNEAGLVVGGADPARMWGAAIDEATGEPAVQSLVPTSLENGEGGLSLVLTPDPSFFTDPRVTYPVTIDPAVTLTLGAATYVDSSNPDIGLTTISEFRSGLWTGGAKYRSFMGFDPEPIIGTRILSASLQLYETWSYSCTPSQVELYSLQAALPSPVTWNNQPAAGTLYASASVAKGYSASCPAGPITLQSGGANGATLTHLAQLWADGNETPPGIVIRASDEADVNGGKKFAPPGGANPPSLSVTYNNFPDAPTNLSTSSGGPGSTVLHATYSDPDGGIVLGHVQYSLYDAAGALITTGSGTSVASGNDSPYTISTSVFQQAKIWKARGYDGNDYSPYSVTGNSCIVPEGPPPGADLSETPDGHLAYEAWLATDGAQAAVEAIGARLDTTFGEVDDDTTIAGRLAAGLIGTAIDETTHQAVVVVDFAVADEQSLDTALQDDVANALQGQTGFGVRVAASCFSSSALTSALSALNAETWHPDAAQAAYGFYLSAHGSVFHVNFQRHSSVVALALESALGGLVSIDYQSFSLDYGRQSDASPHWGGAGVAWQHGDYVDFCTAGFSVTFDDGRRGSVTAGHCFPRGALLKSKDLFYEYGIVTDPYLYAHFDMARLTKSGQSYANVIYTDPILPSYGYRYVTGKRPTKVGNLVCNSGWVTLAKCGMKVITISYVWRRPPPGLGGDTYPVILAERAGRVNSKRGDSGMPVFTRPNATDAFIRGLHFGSLDKGRIVGFQSVYILERQLHVTVP